MRNGKFSQTIDAYIKRCTPEAQRLLKQMRATVKKAAPRAREEISYGMPVYRMERVVVYFNACKHHIGFYPGVAAVKKFKAAFKGHKLTKGGIQMPFDKKLPLAKIAQVVRFRVKESAKKTKRK